MHFCSQCSNMYYISINPTNEKQLVYYCRNCGHINDQISVSNVVVMSSDMTAAKHDPKHAITPYTKFDPTLPRVNNVLCPNEQCPTNTHSVPREILSIRYDDLNMKYLYLCATCDATWKSDTI